MDPGKGDTATPGGTQDGGTGGAEVPDIAPASTLAELIRQYEAGAFGRAEFGVKLAGFPPYAGADVLKGAVDEIVLLRARPTPYVLAANLTIGAPGALLIEAGASVTVGARVTIDIKGKLYVLGTTANPVIIAGASKASAFQTISLGQRSEIVGAEMRWAATLITAKGTGKTPLLVEDSKLDDFTQSAVEVSGADALVVRKNRIGMETKIEDATCEAIHGEASALLIEGNTFGRRAGYNDVFDLQPCPVPHNPMIVGNTFLGGDDDGIDLDACDAVVIGNHLSNFRPGPTAAGAANGGGVTGAGGNAIIIGNVIENCLHAIGFKDGAKPFILNNTIINNDIGITMYSAGAPPAATGVAINNILWNNKTDVILNGSWFPAYNQTKTGSLEATHNVVKDPSFAGKDQNSGGDPLLDIKDGLPGLQVGSPARGTGQGDLSVLGTKTTFPMDSLRAWLDKDLAGVQRPFADGKFTGIDRGATQNR